MNTHTELDDLPIYKDYKVLQVSTHTHDRPVPGLGIWKEFKGTMHSDNVGIGTNDKYTFPEMEGPGKIINIWFTMTPAVPVPKGVNPQDFLMDKSGKLNMKYIRKHARDYLRMVRRVIRHEAKPIIHKEVYIKIYFDDEDKPTVDCPLGDFFGTGFGNYKHYWSRYLNTTAGGYVCNFHMPYKKKARVEIVNTSKKYGVIAFYGAITYAKYKSVDAVKDMGYFHCNIMKNTLLKRECHFYFLIQWMKNFGERKVKGTWSV